MTTTAIGASRAASERRSESEFVQSNECEPLDTLSPRAYTATMPPRWTTLDTRAPLASLAAALRLGEPGGLPAAHLAKAAGLHQPAVPNALADERAALAAGRAPRTALSTLLRWAEGAGFEVEIRVRKKSTEP